MALRLECFDRDPYSRLTAVARLVQILAAGPTIATGTLLASEGLHPRFAVSATPTPRDFEPETPRTFEPIVAGARRARVPARARADAPPIPACERLSQASASPSRPVTHVEADPEPNSGDSRIGSSNLASFIPLAATPCAFRA
jgi:hypothetical protein